MVNLDPARLAVLHPSEMDEGDRIIGWHGDDLFEVPLDSTYDREWTVMSTAAGAKWDTRVWFDGGTHMDFAPSAMMIVIRPEVRA